MGAARDEANARCGKGEPVRFNSAERLDLWQNTGRFPAIHNDMAHAFSSFARGERALDLCCSFGLLAERIKRMYGAAVVGVDADESALEHGRSAGITVDLLHMAVSADTLPALADLIASRKVSVLLARRCLPELFGGNIALGREFAQLMRDSGIEEVLIEGRVKTKKPRNALASIEDEIELMSGPFSLERRYRNVAYMRG